ncbi:MAG TPA: methylated-DNA--[protein]-cysteine S-methyltransferase [Candidatus Onthousia faecipullorum]|uniref:Methylated-DNA--[protein]-cysteine S-methyltransferase n=1 Tax=Candidatus Onthousia faecipullorum TaxID=2840887 RepID=A0A9D1KBU6_9FIRM|nr:methylated-DNA--[protein]-cysteine S-methyltransferase [Candidatus Onthousia faecipullorum]
MHVSYLSFYESPIGLIRINTSFYDVLSLTFIEEQTEEERENHLSIRVKEELDLYFKGELKSFSFYNYLISGLERRVLEVVSHIPYGETLTYKDIARFLGNEEMINPVIAVLNENPCPILIPCHRVIDDKTIGSYVSDIEKKEYLLNLEKDNY